jgi:hypothetical protein
VFYDYRAPETPRADLEPSREIREKGQNDRPVDRWVPRCVERWWQVGPGVCVALNSKGF